MAKTVGVIGGGLGALSAAIRLAKLGFQVTLFEKNVRLGGKMNALRQMGYYFDTGPSLLTLPFVIDELFDFVQVDREANLQFVPIDPVCQYFFPDGSRFSASADTISMLENLEQTFPQEKSAYLHFLKYSKKIFDTTAEVFLFTPLHEVKKLWRWRTLFSLLTAYRIDPFRTVHRGVTRFFSDPRLVQVFDRYATYNGSNPFSAPATLNIIPYVEYELGSYYITGGMYRLVQVLEKIATDLGVDIHTSATVEKIEHLNRKVTGLWVNGKFLVADYIVSGADVVSTYENLITGFEKHQRKLNKLEPSLSGMVFLWGIKQRNPQLSHHNIFFSADYQKEFTQIFDQKRIPEDPTIYLSITSKSDPAHAPSESENWFVLLNMPYLAPDQDWKEGVKKMRVTVLDKLKKSGIDVASRIEFEQTYTPQDFLELYGGNRGSIYGISSNSRLTAFKRPANRDRQLAGLYFAGGSTHPGGGIPLVLLSGKMAAELIAEKEGLLRYQSDTLTCYLKNCKKHSHSIMMKLD